MIRRLVVVAIVVFAFVCTALGQKANVSIDYTVPADWHRTKTNPNINIESPDGLATVAISLNGDPSPTSELAEKISRALRDQFHSSKVVSTSPFAVADQQGTRLELEAQAQRRSKPYRYSIVSVKRRNISANIICAGPVADYERYRAGLEKIVQSVRINIEDGATASDPNEYSNRELGMRMKLEPGWKLLSEAPGKYSGTAKAVFVPESGVAMVALSIDASARSHGEQVAFVMQNIKEQSKSFEKLGEKEVVIAGLPGTRVELMTETSGAVKLRRVVHVFSQGGKHYVAAASGAEGGDYEKHAEAMQRMIDSVKLIEN